jgi:phenylpyruvate tautomerase PptA (4-oxalocrotonate tautomerase family)
MPLVKLEMRRGLAPATKAALLDAVHQALMVAFAIPDRDRQQRFVEYAPEDFQIPPGRGEHFVIVQIDAFVGRSVDAKRRLHKEIVERFEALGIPRLDVFILVNEAPKENWGVRGGVAGCDIEFDFKIEV